VHSRSSASSGGPHRRNSSPECAHYLPFDTKLGDGSLSDTARTRLAAIATPKAGLAGQLRRSIRRSMSTWCEKGVETGLAEQVRAYGLQEPASHASLVRRSPRGHIAAVLDRARSYLSGFARTGMVARLIGIAIGNTELRGEMRRETELRTSLEGAGPLGTIGQPDDRWIVTTRRQPKSLRTVNPAAERLYGFRAEEAIGCPVRTSVPAVGARRPAAGPEWSATLASVGYWHGRVIHRP